MDYPKTKKDPVAEIIHGVSVVDNYRWLEDIESEKVSKWLDEQDVFTRSTLDNLPHRQELNREFQKLFREETLGFPHPRKGRYFFMKRMADEDLSVLYVQEGLHGEPRGLVDPNKISKEKGFPVNLAGYSISKDGKFITYNLSETANDQSALYVMNVDTGEGLSDEIPANLYPGSGSWAIDNSGFWYTRRKEDVPRGEEKFHRKVYFHKLGASFSDDNLVFGENFAKEDWLGASATSDGRFLLLSVQISSEKYERSEIYILDLNNPENGIQEVIRGIKGNENIYFSGYKHREYLYIVTNYGAPKYKIDRVLLSNIEKGMSAWESVIPEGKDVLDNFSFIKDKLFVVNMQNVHSAISEYSLDGKFKKVIPLPTLGSSSSLIGEHEGEEAFFGFNSFAYPYTIFRLDLNTEKIEVFKKQKVDIDVERIDVKQVWYESKDGTKIPMFLVHKKDLELNGKIPTLLYGYGGFNISLQPNFTKGIIPFIQKGGMYAVANIRGGGEFGEEWHRAGIKKQKQNVFDDFIAAAEWLFANDYTDSAHLVIEGGSNGGLLVGAVMNQRPELAKAVIMAVPVSDMLRYHLFHGGRHWIPDYGCAEDEDMFPYLLGYSPYHNIKDGVQYPSTLIVTSDKDDRVHPGQAFKMTAKLQEAGSSNPVLLRVERKAGHSGAADISRYIEKAVDEWSFIFWQLGM